MIPMQRQIRNTLYFLILACACLLAPVSQAQAQSVSSLPIIDARSYILMNAATGQILAAKNAYRPYAIASLSKLMTLYLLFQDIDAGHLQLHQEYTPCPAALQTGGSSMFLRQTIRVVVGGGEHAQLLCCGIHRRHKVRHRTADELSSLHGSVIARGYGHAENQLAEGEG